MKSIVVIAIVLLHACTRAHETCVNTFNKPSPKRNIIVIVSHVPMDTTVIKGGKVMKVVNKEVVAPLRKTPVPQVRTELLEEMEPDTGTNVPPTVNMQTKIGDNVTTSSDLKTLQQIAEAFKCTEEGPFPIVGNCSAFYYCRADGEGGFIRDSVHCGRALVWDSNIGGCNQIPYVPPPCGTKTNVKI